MLTAYVGSSEYYTAHRHHRDDYGLIGKSGETEQQTVALLLETAPGEWKENPLLGADARRQLGGMPDPYWALQTKKMIRACGIDVSNVSMADDGSINIV